MGFINSHVREVPNFSNNASQIILVNNAILVVSALRNVFSLVFTDIEYELDHCRVSLGSNVDIQKFRECEVIDCVYGLIRSNVTRPPGALLFDRDQRSH